MNTCLKIAVFSAAVFMLAACQKKEDCLPAPTGLQGTWIWEKSIGGLGGWTLTPQTERVQKKLVIDDTYYREYVDGSLVFESGYDFEVRPDSFFNTNKYLLFSQFGERAVWYDDTSLEVHELCFDCFTHYYRRK